MKQRRVVINSSQYLPTIDEAASAVLLLVPERSTIEMNTKTTMKLAAATTG